MTSPRKQKHDYVYDAVKKLLVYIYDSAYGIPIEEITKKVWPNWRGMDGPRFRQEAKYIERIIGDLRRDAVADYYARVADAMNNAQGNPRMAARQVPGPDFMPWALAQKEHFWCYFNCVRKPFVNRVEVILRQRADGLIKSADFLDEAFKL